MKTHLENFCKVKKSFKRESDSHYTCLKCFKGSVFYGVKIVIYKSFSLDFSSAKNVSRHIRKVHGLERSFNGENLSNLPVHLPTRAQRRKQEKQLKNSYALTFV